MIDISDLLERRTFLRSALTAAFVSLLHDGPALAEESRAHASTGVDPRRPLIAELRLRTAASLRELRAFYHDRLGFGVLTEKSHQITFTAGQTPLTFVQSDPADGKPFYHFAFNIPENKIRLARDWQLQRWPLITTPAELRDPTFPDDVRHFRHWNAHSVFFWDPADNLVEYIARHDLGNATDGPFTATDILYASEIGLVIDEAVRTKTATTLQEGFGLLAYKTEPGGSFFAMGDEHGLVLLLSNGQRRNVDPTRVTIWEVFPTEVTLRCPKQAKPVIKGYPYEIRAIE